MRYKFIYLVLLGLILQGPQVEAQVNQTKHITKSYLVNQNGRVEINNKYGKVHIDTWSGDSVKINIEFYAEEKTREKLDKLIAGVDFEFNATSTYITAKTIIGSNRSKLISDLIDFANTISTFGSRVRVDYMVYLPEKVHVTINNEFGDVYVDQMPGELNLKLSHGDFRAGTLNYDSDIEVKFGKAYIRNIKKGNIVIHYGDLNLNKADYVFLESKSSDIRIDAIKFLKIDSRRDHFRIELIDQFRGTSYFSHFEIENLRGFVNMGLNYGSFNIDRIDQSFTIININSRYTDMRFIFNKGISYTLELQLEKVYFSYPDVSASVNVKEVEGEKYKKVSGYIGPNATSNKRLKIKSYNADLELNYF